MKYKFIVYVPDNGYAKLVKDSYQASNVISELVASQSLREVKLIDFPKYIVMLSNGTLLATNGQVFVNDDECIIIPVDKEHVSEIQSLSEMELPEANLLREVIKGIHLMDIDYPY